MDALAAFKQSRSPTPLSTFLAIYDKSYPEAYYNYMEGAIALAEYLKPISIPVTSTTVPRMANNYEIQQLSIILQSYTSSPNITSNQIGSAIYELIR